MPSQPRRIPSRPCDVSTGKSPKPLAWYQALHVRPGAAEQHLHQDALSAQRDFARRLSTAVATEATENQEADAITPPPITPT